MVPLTLMLASTLLVANQTDRTLSLVDPATHRQIAAVEEGAITGHEVAGSPDGKTAWVPIYGNSGVGHPGTDGSKMVVIDLASRKVTGTVDFGHGVRPHCVLYEPHDKLLYVTTELDQAVTIVDPATLQVTGKIPTGQAESHMLALTQDGARGYTANVGPGTVSVLDLKARKTVTIIKVAPHVQRISISRGDRWVFTSDTSKPRLAVIDTATNAIASWIELPGTGYGTASTKDGSRLLVCIPKLGEVAVINLGTFKVETTISVPKAPQEILVRPDGKVAYVSCNVSHEVAVVDLASWQVLARIEAGKGADGLGWAGP